MHKSEMAFWGVKLEPGKPYTHSYNSSLGRLRISKATLDLFSPKTGYVAVQCKVGNKSPVFLCSMHSGTDNLSCMLDIEFEEKEADVVFEVTGCGNVHLTGFYLGQNGQCGNANKHGVCCGDHTAQGKNVVIEKEELNDQEVEYMDTEVNGRHVRTMASGLVIEDIEVNKYHNVAIACSGSTVLINYSTQLKRTGCVVQSNFGYSPERFTLGEGKFSKGLDFGINGMRVSDKRRLTVPPSMGYWEFERSDVPADAWLLVEVELKDVLYSKDTLRA